MKRRRARRGEGERLRDEIIEATEHLLVETGDVEQVSIREVASAVGVTAPSIYRHFADKTHLIFEVCTRQFERLAAQTAGAVADESDPLEGLAIVGRSYIRFAIDNPEYYRVMFMRRGDYTPPEFDLRSEAVFLGAMELIRQAMDTGQIARSDPYVAALHVWAHVHGLASLLIAKPRVDWPQLDTLIDDHVAMGIRCLSSD